MDFIDSVIMTRSSVRSFTGEGIPTEVLSRIVKAGFAAPSAVNVQPWELVVVTERARLDALCAGLPHTKMLDKAAAAVVVCGDPRKDRDFARQYWEVDCSAMTQNILLAAHALGLGAVWSALHPDKAKKDVARRELGIPKDIEPFCVVPIGVIAGRAPAPKDKYRPAAVHPEKW
jgi:nitroreductase